MVFTDLAMLDTSAKAENGVMMELRHPVTKDMLGIQLLLRGADSKIVKSASARFRQVMDNDKLPESNKEQAANDLAVKCILEIHGAKYNGELIESTDEGKRLLVEKFGWVALQIFDFINDLENFLPDSNSI